MKKGKGNSKEHTLAFALVSDFLVEDLPGRKPWFASSIAAFILDDFDASVEVASSTLWDDCIGSFFHEPDRFLSGAIASGIE